MVKITHKYGLSSLSIFNAITPHIIAYMWDVGSSPDSKVQGANIGPIWGRQDQKWAQNGR